MWWTLHAALALAGDPCRHVRVADDPFTGRVERGLVSFDDKGRAWGGILRSSEGTWLSIGLLVQGHHADAVAPGDLIELATEGGILRLPAYQAVPPTHDSTVDTRLSTWSGWAVARTTHASHTTWEVPYALDADTLKQLAASPVTALKVWVGERPIQIEISEKRPPTLKTVAGCFVG